MYDEEGNSLIIPLRSACRSELRSPKKRFIVTERIEDESIIVIPSPKTSPKMSRMEAYYNKYFRERNKQVEFVEEGHTYYINGSRTNVMSVTTFIDEVALPSTFNADYVSNRILNGEDYKNNTSPYSGKTAAEIRQIWQMQRYEAADHGTKVHWAVERALRAYDRNEPLSSIPNLPAAFVAFMAHNPRMKPVAVETPVYDQDLRLAGTFDILMELEPDLNPFDGGAAQTKKTILIDLKTSQRDVSPSDLFECNVKDKPSNLNPESTTAGRIPLRSKRHPHLQSFSDSDFTHWLVQTNIYADLLAKHYKINVDEIYILQIPSRDLADVQYNLIPVSRMSMEPLFATRQAQLRQLFNY